LRCAAPGQRSRNKARALEGRNAGMRYMALACDYDGTLTQNGRVDATTIAALKRLRDSGRVLVLVTGRELEDLLEAFPEADLFGRVVAENGALLYHPASRTTKILADSPPQAFIDALRKQKLQPLGVGRVIVSTCKPWETLVLKTIRDLGLELHVIFNKDSVMVLPAGVDKASGLRAALQELQLSPHAVVSIGDAENDHALLSMCERAVAVNNAVPAVKKAADLVTAADGGLGVEELIEHLLKNDLEDV
jgi:hydroxymethylpyrimidine pyrophosphatase-like HAD family hydrolase